jgi:crotonobetainyl-CoA:carnitine CoA-transferase CaiB-like acyl-CoA transferase
MDDGILKSYRVLDLTNEKGALCGKMLADMGADVIKIEPPEGDPSRRIGPFYHDEPHPERSLFWFAYNANKRGITLNLASGDGARIFRRLVENADVIVESFQPGYMDGLGLGYQRLKKINSRIVVATITPFGLQDGAKDIIGDSDLMVMASSGMMSLCGDDDRAPVRIGYPQAYLHASGQCAVGIAIALYVREMTGKGQHVDVSAQQSTIPSCYSARPAWDLNRTIIERAGCMRKGHSIHAIHHQTWRCKDGYVTFLVLAGVGGKQSNKNLLSWMNEEGCVDDFLKRIDWDEFDVVTANQEIIDQISQRIGKFFLAHTKEELYEGARNRSIMLAPVNTIEDILKDRQLKERNFWRVVPHPELSDTLIYPGAFARFSSSPGDRVRKAPQLGEHNQEIFGELGFTKSDLVAMKTVGII